MAEPANPVSSNPSYLAARGIAETLRHAGHQAYLAGGCVRDLLLGLEPKDYDVATSATPKTVLELFPTRKALTVGAHFGVVLICESDPNAISTEVATFRHDGSYSDGRRPDAVQFSTSPREDVLRRDFTINGMLLDPAIYDQTGDATQATLDYVHGREDLSARIIRAIGASPKTSSACFEPSASLRASASPSIPPLPQPSSNSHRRSPSSAPSASGTS
jgi:poly(A) polymerase